MPVATEWIPVLAADLPGAETYEAFRCEHERDIVLGDIVAAAGRRGLQPLRWPNPFPFDSALAMRAATYARQIGRTVAFALAAFRQAFAAGRVLDADGVLIAAAAGAMHPTAGRCAAAAAGMPGPALRRAAGRRWVRGARAREPGRAASLGVRDVPAIVVGE